MKTPRPASGFTLIETLIALTVLAIASVGALAAIGASQRQIKDGQTRQYREVLLDATAQRWEVASKLGASAIFNGNGQNLTPKAIGTACPGGTPCNQMAIGTWDVDPTTPIFDPNTNFADLSTGAYYMVNSNGTLVQLTAITSPAVPAGTLCGSGVLPANSYCREVLVTAACSPPFPCAGATPTPIVTATPGAPWTVWPPPPMSGTATPLPMFTSPAAYLNNYTPTVVTLWVRVSGTGDTCSTISCPVPFFSMTVVF
jgi:prepilin-type N-terminal cleavage/methylation domain-containing protein